MKIIRNPSHGFSLIEVLLSLTLASIMALILAQQQELSKLLLYQLLLRSKATNLLDKAEENLLFSHSKISLIAPPYHLNMDYGADKILVEIKWLNHQITRHHKNTRL